MFFEHPLRETPIGQVELCYAKSLQCRYWHPDENPRGQLDCENPEIYVVRALAQQDLDLPGRQ